MEFDELIKRYPDDENRFYEKGYLFLSFLVKFLEKHHGIDESLMVFDKFIKLYPNDENRFYEKGYLFL